MKKKIKIFAIPSHDTDKRTSGVDMARVIQPMEHLDGYELDGYTFETNVFRVKRDGKKNLSYFDLAKEYDVFFFNYTAMVWAFAAMGAAAEKEGKLMIMDSDDNLWSVQPDNPSYKGYHPGSEALKNFTAMCGAVDYMTTTNSYLKNVICHNTTKKHNDVKVLPNYIDFDLYTHRSKFKDDFEINLLHFGSTTHFQDLAEEEFSKGIDKIMKEYPNVKLTTVGAFLPGYKRRWGTRYNNAYGHTDVYAWIKEKYPDFMDQADIIVTPLEDNAYTRCKSSIKFLEASSAKKPGVWQNMRQYRELVDDGNNGYLAATADQWYKSIKALIDDKEHRRSVAEKAFKTTESWQMKDHIHEYAEFILKAHLDNQD